MAYTEAIKQTIVQAMVKQLALQHWHLMEKVGDKSYTPNSMVHHKPPDAEKTLPEITSTHMENKRQISQELQSGGNKYFPTKHCTINNPGRVPLIKISREGRIVISKTLTTLEQET